MTSDIPDGRRVAVRAYPMTILRYAASSRADGRAQSDGQIRIGVATGSGVSAQAQRLTGSLPYWELELVLGWRPKRCRLKDEHTWHFAFLFLSWFVLLHRQNVVIVGAGRTSRSARFATSSELLYLLNLLYNMPSEYCDEYKLTQLYQKSSVWCFAFSHTSTLELIPAVATAQPGALVTIRRSSSGSRAMFQVR